MQISRRVFAVIVVTICLIQWAAIGLARAEPESPSSSSSTTSPPPPSSETSPPSEQSTPSTTPEGTTEAPPSVESTTESPIPSPSSSTAAECSRGRSGERTNRKWSATVNPKRTIVRGKMRSDCEQVPKPFTKADADKAETMEAQLTTARVAAGCQVYWPAPYEVCGLIRDKYNQLGGPNSFLLFPKTNELTNPDRTGKRSEFVGGNIYWHPSTTARPVAHDFLTKWGDHGYESGFLKVSDH